MTDEKGNPLLKKNGKPMFRASYSILQDELFNYMTERGFKGFQRGEYGSTAEHFNFPAISNPTGQRTIGEVAEAYSKGTG